jgi:hypothetical protein
MFLRETIYLWSLGGRSGKADGQVSGEGHGQVLPALFRRTLGPYRRDYYTSANHEDLQGVKHPRGPVGIHATYKCGRRYSQPPIAGLTKYKCYHYYYDSKGAVVGE